MLCYDALITMGWVENETTTHFDEEPIEGLFFLSGNQLAFDLKRDWIEGQKFPMIAFPSGVECPLWESGDPKTIGIVHLYGEMDLPLGDTRDSAYLRALSIAEQCGYAVRKVGDDGVEVWGHDVDEYFLVIYDDEAGRMANVIPRRDQRAFSPEKKPLFRLGRVVATPGALDAIDEAEQNPAELLARHITGDWGQLDEHDRRENDLSVEQGYRILSAYILRTGVKVWVITEADRSATTLLLPSEY